MYVCFWENAFLKAYGRYDVVLEKGEGVYLYDTNGRRYLDFYAGIGVNSLGYHYPAYVEAMQKQMATLTHVSNYFYTPIAVEAAEAVKKATQLEAVFFCNSGTEATEGALKLARKYYYLKHYFCAAFCCLHYVCWKVKYVHTHAYTL